MRQRGQIWWISVTVNGRQLQFSTQTTDYKTALKIYYKIVNGIAEGNWFEKLVGEYKTVRELLEKYLKEVSPRKAPSTRTRDKSLAANLIRIIGTHKLTKTSPQIISDFKKTRRQEGAAPQTVNHELALLRHAFNVASNEWQWTKDNPAAKVKKEKVDNIRDRCLTEEEEVKLLSESPEWLKEIVVFGLATGFRRGEILALEWSQIDMFKRTVFIGKQKNRGRDTLPLNSRALEVLKKRAKVRHIKTSHVFYSQNGTPIIARNLMRAFYEACKRAGVTDLCFHDLRRSFCTRLIRSGADPLRVQRLMRQRDPAMLERYAHHDAESIRDAVEKLDKKNDKKMTMEDAGDSSMG